MKKFGEKGTYIDEFEDEKSKSQIKRELLALKEIGKTLLELPSKDLAKLNLSERLYEALIKAQTMTHGARKREIGFIGGIMVHEDYDEIKQSIDKIRQEHNGDVRQFHQLEQWRDQLLANDNDIMATLREQYPQFDSQHVRQLVRNANKEASQEKPAKSARLLFKYLQECQVEVSE